MVLIRETIHIMVWTISNNLLFSFSFLITKNHIFNLIVQPPTRSEMKSQVPLWNFDKFSYSNIFEDITSSSRKKIRLLVKLNEKGTWIEYTTNVFIEKDYRVGTLLKPCIICLGFLDKLCKLIFFWVFHTKINLTV